MLALSLAQLRAHTTRLVATVLAIVIAVGFVVATLVLNQTSSDTVRDAVARQYRSTDAVVTVDQSIETTTGVVGLGARPGLVERVAAVGGAGVIAVDRSAYVQTRLPGKRSYRWTRVSDVAPAGTLQWQQVTAGRLPTATGEVAIGAEAGVPVGTVLELLVRPTTPGGGAGIDDPEGDAAPATPQRVRVVGLVDLQGAANLSDDQMFAVPAQTAAWSPQDAEAIRIAGTPGTDPDALVERIRAALAAEPEPGLAVRTGEDEAAHTADVYAGTGLAQILVVFGTVAVLVCGLVIANTFAVLLVQRTRELALLRCVGATGRQLRRGVLLESLVIGVLASLAGVAAGIGLAAGVSALAQTLGSPVALSGVSVPPSAVAIGMAIGILVTVGAAFAPARRATRVSPLAALRPMDAAPLRTRAGLLRRAAGVVLLIPGAVVLGVGAAQGIVLVGMAGGILTFLAVVLLAQWLVPPVVALAGRLAGPGGGVPGRLAASNALRNPQRTATTAIALIIGVSLTATMVVGAASTRATTATMLDRAFPTDISVSPGGDPAVLPAGLEAAVAGLPGVQAAMPLTLTTVGLAGGGPGYEGQVLGLDPARARSVVRSTGGAGVPQPGTLNVPAGSTEVWGAEGTTVRLTAGDRQLSLRVHVVDEDLPLAATMADLARLDPAAQPALLWVRLADGLDADARAEALDLVSGTASDLSPDSTVQSSTEQRDSFDELVDVLLLVVTGLLGVAVVIALIGVGNTIALSVVERRQESGLLRALGLTRRQLRWMLLWEALLIAGVAAGIGLALGVLYGALGTASALSAQGPIVIDVPWLQLLAILVVATVAGALASVLPSRRAARISPVAAIAAV